MITVFGAAAGADGPAAAAPRRRRRAPAPAIVPSRSASTRAASSTIGPREVLTRMRSRASSAPSSSRADQAAASGRRARGGSSRRRERAKSSSLGRRARTPTSAARASVRFWLHARRPSRRPAPTRATRAPRLPRPSTPRVLPCEAEAACSPAACPRGSAVLRGHAPDSARISAQVSSAVGYGSPPRAAHGDAALGRGLDVDRRVAHAGGDESLRFGSRSRTDRAKRACARASRSRRRTPASRATSSSASARWSGKNYHVVPAGKRRQSAMRRATFW